MTVSAWTIVVAVFTAIGWIIEKFERRRVQQAAKELADQTLEAQRENTAALRNLELILQKRVEAFSALNTIINEKEQDIVDAKNGGKGKRKK